MPRVLTMSKHRNYLLTPKLDPFLSVANDVNGCSNVESLSESTVTCKTPNISGYT